MSIPNVNYTFPANGLGNAPPSPSSIIAVVGPASTGTAAVPRSLGGSAQSVANVFGYGPMPDLAGNLAQSGTTVVCVRSTATAGVVGSVTFSGTGTSDLTVTGNSLDRYNVIVTVVRSGTVGDDAGPGLTFSFDNGRTTTGEIRVPTNGIVSTFAAQYGLTFTFTDTAPNATMVAGDTYTLSAAAPTSTAAQVVTALQGLAAGSEPFSYVYVTGAYSAADCATIISQIGTMRAADWFVGVILESVDVSGSDTEADWMQDLQDDFTNVVQSNFASIAAGYIPVQSAITGCYFWRSVGWMAAVRLALVSVSRDLAAVADGALVPYQNANPAVALFVPTGKFVHDERVTPGLDADKFLTIRSFAPNTTANVGYYVTNPRVMSSGTSDYKYIQYVRIANEAARSSQSFWQLQLSSDVLVNPGTGRILDSVARQLEQGSDEAMAALINGQEVSALRTVVSRDDDIINTETLTVTIQIVPKPYVKQIPISVTFTKALGG